MLDRLTIVIPTYGRQAYLARQAAYWRNKGPRLLILDGTGEAWSGGASAGPHVRYLHRPESIERRLRFAAEQIETDWAALLSDDEFFLPSGLEACLRHLAAHPQVVACKGVALSFGREHGRTTGCPVYPELRHYAVTGDTPRARMRRHMRPYAMATLWAVMRGGVFSATLRAMGAAGPFGSAAAGEIQASLVAAYFGECRVLDELMWLRSTENRNIWWDAGRLSLAQWYLDPRNAAEVEAFLDGITAQVPAGEAAEARSALRDAVGAYVAWSSASGTNDGPALRERLLAKLPRPVTLALKRVLRPFRAAADKLLLEAGADLARTGVTVDLAGLAEIEGVVSAFHAPVAAQ